MADNQQVLDYFNDTGATSITSHTPDVGGTWVAHPSYGAVGEISSTADSYVRSSAAFNVAMSPTVPTSADQYCNFNVQLNSVTYNQQVGVILRLNATVDTGYFCWFRPGGTGYDVQLYRKVSGSFGSAIAQYEIVTLATGPHSARFSCVDEAGDVRLIMTVDSVEVINFLDTDATRITGTGRYALVTQSAESNGELSDVDFGYITADAAPGPVSSLMMAGMGF